MRLCFRNKEIGSLSFESEWYASVEESITVYVYRPRIVRIYIGVSERDGIINYD
jgi:hypothetical protein